MQRKVLWKLFQFLMETFGEFQQRWGKIGEMISIEACNWNKFKLNVVFCTERFHFFDLIFSIKDSCNSSPHLFQLPNPLKPEQNYTFQVYKGTHINSVISYKDVEFVANSTISKGYYSWVRNMVASAEEHHSPTLLRLRINSSNVRNLVG